jgi:predicted ATPase
MIIRICQRLDGLPLAIALAAAWLRVLSLEQILSRLQDRYRLARVGDQEASARHQTLRAAIACSFDLCSGPQRTLWGRLSVFAGDFDIDEAEAVCAGDGMEASDVFTGLAGLLDKSVLVRIGAAVCRGTN